MDILIITNKHYKKITIFNLSLKRNVKKLLKIRKSTVLKIRSKKTEKKIVKRF